MECSVIIATSNRADSLEKTLRAFEVVRVPSEWNAELILVDNASKDRTAEVVRAVKLRNFSVRYFYEGRIGKGNALNTALSEARGDALLFTDDDVVPAADWLEKMASPLLDGKCEGVAGQIQLAEELLRPWMETDHRTALSAPGAQSGEVKELIGANMGLHRSVFDRISGFDPELGPGASGFGEETLLSWQMSEAGFRLISVPDALIVHYPDAARLRHSDWLGNALKRGCSQAYIMHHWQHGGPSSPRIRYWGLRFKLCVRRVLQPPPARDEEGCPQWEMSYVAEMEMCRQFLRERQRPRNYSRHGLRKSSVDGTARAEPTRQAQAISP
jgi:glycosyltransferase involved in cell wall biosynthesis